MHRRHVALIIVLFAAGGWFARAAEPKAADGDAAALIGRLEDNDFNVRDDARSRLLKRVTDPKTSGEVVRLAESKLADKKTSLEVREVLETLLKVKATSPKPTPAAPAEKPPTAAVGDAEIDALLDALAAATFDVRDRAERQLITAGQSPATCGAVLSRLLARDESPEATVDAARRWESIWQVAWGTWLAGDDQVWRPALPGDQDRTETINRLVAPEATANRPPWVRTHANASRRLLLWLAEEGAEGRTAAALKERLEKSDLSPDAAARLDAVFVWTHPAMAAEFWTDSRHQAVQHLMLGIPNQPPGAPRPSLFDRCDEKTAHCVSGNSLAPGDHPVGVFFPHPSELQQNAMFHLVNLPTPRRRLAYEFIFPISKKSDEELDRISDRRRGPITRRTVDYLLAQKRLLTVREIDTFQYLDPIEASRFIEPYLSTINDERYEDGSPTSFGNGSLHGWFAYQMTNVGTPEAGRGLAAAIDKGRFLEPTAVKPYRVEWAAVLDLARMAPWPDVDRWLADHLDRKEALKIDEPESADIGASCAALLLERHSVDPASFDLEHCEFDELIDLEQPGYRFAKPEGRESVKAWWREKRRDDAARLK